CLRREHPSGHLVKERSWIRAPASPHTGARISARKDQQSRHMRQSCRLYPEILFLFIGSKLLNYIVLMVPGRGLEPPRCYPLVPETSASTNSATRAGQGRRRNLRTASGAVN